MPDDRSITGPGDTGPVHPGTHLSADQVTEAERQLAHAHAELAHQAQYPGRWPDLRNVISLGQARNDLTKALALA